MDIDIALFERDGEFVLQDERDGEEYVLENDQIVDLALMYLEELHDDPNARIEGARRHLHDIIEEDAQPDPDGNKTICVDFDTDSDEDREFLEWVGIEPDLVGEEEFQYAVDQLCNELGGERSSLEIGEYNGHSDYKVEVYALGPEISPLFGPSLEIGGWVTLQKSDWTIWCDLGLKIGGELVTQDSAFRGQYDREQEEWPQLELEGL